MKLEMAKLRYADVAMPRMVPTHEQNGGLPTKAELLDIAVCLMWTCVMYIAMFCFLDYFRPETCSTPCFLRLSVCFCHHAFWVVGALVLLYHNLGPGDKKLLSDAWDLYTGRLKRQLESYGPRLFYRAVLGSPCRWELIFADYRALFAARL
ncbi:unnamed protein product, partial [Mesorhabditis spiculigera]